jgi:hypothetical protein
MATKFSKNEPQEEKIWLLKNIACNFKTSNWSKFANFEPSWSVKLELDLDLLLLQ